MDIEKNKEIKKTLVAGRKISLASNIYLLFWEIQGWTASKWVADGWTAINSDQVKLIYLLSGGHRLSNNELASLSGVTKQAVSQMVATLVKRGVLNIEINPLDTRAKLISLTDYGSRFLSYLASSTDELMEEYANIIGHEKMKLLTEISMELAEKISKNKR